MSRIFEDNSFAIGRTPLVKLNSVTKNAKATVLAKIEGRNMIMFLTPRKTPLVKKESEANEPKKALRTIN